VRQSSNLLIFLLFILKAKAYIVLRKYYTSTNGKNEKAPQKASKAIDQIAHKTPNG